MCGYHNEESLLKNVIRQEGVDLPRGFELAPAFSSCKVWNYIIWWSRSI